VIAILQWNVHTVIVISTIVVSTQIGQIREFIWNVRSVHLWIREGACLTSANPHCTGLTNLTFLCNFIFASVTLGGTVTHLHITHGPVDLRVVLLEPTKPKYHLALPQSCDCKLGSFGMIVELHDNVNNVMNCTLLIGGPIHIVHRNSPC